MDPLKQVYTTYALLYASLIENAESVFLISRNKYMHLERGLVVWNVVDDFVSQRFNGSIKANVHNILYASLIVKC